MFPTGGVKLEVGDDNNASMGAGMAMLRTRVKEHV